MIRSLFAAALATVSLMGAGAAHAGPQWSIGISLPPVGVVVADAPRYRVREPAPVYYAPPPVIYAPAPRYVTREVYYAPPPRVVYETHYHAHRWDRRHERWHERHERWNDRWDDRGDGPRRGH